VTQLTDYQWDAIRQVISGELAAAVRHVEAVKIIAHTFGMTGTIEDTLLRSAITTIKAVDERGFKEGTDGTD